ncbi:MAG TPA: sugar transferase, partial [Chitinophagaceae bacterium]|nr:sugar transferase [Chitinophagaceae bacterium]
MNQVPVTLFTYNRVSHLKQTVDALRKNRGAVSTDLFIYSDAPITEDARADVANVREFLHSINGFKSVTIIERNTNYGLGKNIIEGVSEMIERFGRIIILEDDL